MGLWVTWDWVCKNWDCILFAFFFVYTAVLPCIATCSARLGGTTEDPGDIMSRTTCKSHGKNCTTVFNRVYDTRPDYFHYHHGECRKEYINFVPFQDTTDNNMVFTCRIEHIPTPDHTIAIAAAAVVIVVLIGLIVLIYIVIKHWTDIDLYCRTCFASVNTETVIMFVILLFIICLYCKQLEANRSMHIQMQASDARNRQD